MLYDAVTDISNTQQGEEEGNERCGKREDLPVSLEDLEVVRQACDHGLHTAHLVERIT